MAKIYNQNRIIKENERTQNLPVSSNSNVLKVTLPTNQVPNQRMVPSLKLPDAQPTVDMPHMFTKPTPVISEFVEDTYAEFRKNKAEESWAQEAQEQAQHTNFEYNMEPDQWYISVVDNSVNGGTKLNDYGFLTSYCSDAKDGEVILVNHKGEVQLIEQQELSEDYQAKILEHKRQYQEARDTYDTYYKFEERVAKGADLIETDVDNAHQVNSMLDLVVDGLWDTSDNVSSWFKLKQHDKKHEWDFSKTLDAGNEYLMRNPLIRSGINKMLDSTLGDNWREEYSGSVEALKKFEELNYHDSIKNYMAWQMTQQAGHYVEDKGDGLLTHRIPDYRIRYNKATGNTFKNFFMAIVTDVGDVLDYLANLIKANVHFAGDTIRKELEDNSEYQEGGDYYGQAVNPWFIDSTYQDASYLDTMKAAFAPTWSESGRQSYNINTGNVLIDLIYEVTLDPSFWTSLGLSVFTKNATEGVFKSAIKQTHDAAVKSALKELADDAHVTDVMAMQMKHKVSQEDIMNVVYKRLNGSLTSGKTASELASNIARMSKHEELIEPLTEVLTKAVQYNDYFKLAKSVGIMDASIHKADQIMATVNLSIGPAVYGMRAAIGGVNKSVNLYNNTMLDTSELASKVMADAATDTLKGADTMSLDHVIDFMNSIDANVLGINIAHGEEVLKHIPEDVKLRVILGKNDEICKELEKVLADEPSEVVIQSLLGRLKSITGCDSLEEYSEKVAKILIDGNISDTSALTRIRILMDKCDEIQNGRNFNTFAEAMQQIRFARNQFWNAKKSVNYAKPDYVKLKKYQDFVDSGIVQPPMTYKEFLVSKGVTDHSYMTYMEYYRDVKPKIKLMTPMKYEEFLERHGIDLLTARMEYTKYIRPEYTDIPKYVDFEKEFLELAKANGKSYYRSELQEAYEMWVDIIRSNNAALQNKEYARVAHDNQLAKEYNQTIYNFCSNLYNTYLKRIEAANQDLLDSAYDNMIAYNTLAKAHNERLSALGKEYYEYLKVADNNIYNRYLEYNDTIQDANDMMQAMAYTAYNQAIDIKVRALTFDITTTWDLFKDMDVVDKRIARYNELLEQYDVIGLGEDEWREVFDIMEDALSFQQDRAYQRFNVGTARMPVTDVSEASEEILRNDKLIEAVRDTTSLPTREVTDDFYEYGEKLYRMQITKTKAAETFLANKNISRMAESIVNCSDGFGTAIHEASQTGAGIMKRIADEAINDAHSAYRYQRVCSRVQASTLIPEPLKDALIDKVYNVNKSFKRSFNDVRLDGINADKFSGSYATTKARRFAMKWRDEAMQHVSQSFAATSAKYYDLDCNVNISKGITTDVAVENIQKQHALYGLEDDLAAKRMPVYYSVEFAGQKGGNGPIVSFSMRTGDETVTFTGDISDSLFAQQELLSKVRNQLDVYKKAAGREGRQIQMVGFNTHNSGFDLDSILNDRIYRLRADISMYGTVDIAERIRVQNGLPVISEAAFDELADILKHEILKWHSDMHILNLDGFKIDLYPTINTDSKFTYLVGSAPNFVTPTYVGLYKRCKKLEAAIKSTQNEITNLNEALAESGVLFAEASRNIMPTLREIPGNERGTVIAIKNFYDTKLVGKYFTKANPYAPMSEELFEMCKAFEDTMTRIQDYGELIRNAEAVDVTWDYFKNYKPFQNWLSNHGLTMEMFNNLDTAHKYAVIYTMNKKLPGKKFIDTFDESMFEMYAMFHNDTVLRSADTYGNPYTNLHGSIVSEDSKYWKANTILGTLEKYEQDMLKIHSTLDAREIALKQSGVMNVVEEARLKTQRDAMSSLTDYINSVRKSIDASNARLRTLQEESVADDLIDYADNVAFTQDTALDELYKDMFNQSLEHDHLRLLHIAGQSEEDFYKHLIKECGGKLVIDLEHYDTDLTKILKLSPVEFMEHPVRSADINTIEEILRKADTLDHVKYSVDENYAKIWVDKNSFTQEELDELVESCQDFTLDALRSPIDCVKDLSKYGPNSLTYGMFHANDYRFDKFMTEEFFKDMQNDLLDIPTLDRLGCFSGQAVCSYHGAIEKITRNSDQYISNFQIVNIANVYADVINSLDMTYCTLDYIFNSGNDFAKAVELFENMDGVHGRKAIAKVIEDQGYYVCVPIQRKNGALDIVKLDIRDKVVYKNVLKNKHATLLRYDDFVTIQKQLYNRNLSMTSPAQLGKAATFARDVYRFYQSKIRYPFIQTYLGGKSSTWLRNIVDSVSKATLQNGADYFTYIPQAMKVRDAFSIIEQSILKDFHSVDDITISRYFKKHPDLPMTETMFKDIRYYWNSSVAGTQFERALKAFVADNASIFDTLKLDVPRADRDKVVKLFAAHADESEAMSKRMSDIYAELLKMGYDTETAGKLTGMYPKYIGYVTKMGYNSSWLDKTPVLGKWINFNLAKFSSVEEINRLAIYLYRIDLGENPGQVFKAIAETQFDYSKSSLMQAVESIAPFSTFKFYNIRYWLDSVWRSKNIELLGDIIQAYDQGPTDYGKDYWSDENISYRALTRAYVDSLQDDSDVIQEYDSYKDYKGASASTAIENGWLRIGDKLYFKSGFSLFDPLTMMYSIFTGDGLGEIEDSIFAPLRSLFTIAQDLLKDDEVLRTGVNPYDIQDNAISEFVKDHAYELTSLFPMLGTIYYSIYSASRNSNALVNNGEEYLTSPELSLAVMMPSLFSVAKPDTLGTVFKPSGNLEMPEDYVRKTYATSYYAKPVGTDWYNRSEEYKAAHRYVMGVSYVPAWVNKDPATYIDTWGRMEQMGIPREALPQLFEAGKGWWFTKDDNGTYSLHNYQLMIKDQKVYEDTKATLLKYGWTPAEVEYLLAQVAVPMWDKKQKENFSGVYGYGSFTNRSKSIGAVYASAMSTGNQARYQLNKYSGDGKWSKYDKQPRISHYSQQYPKGTYYGRPMTGRLRKQQVAGHDVSSRTRDYQKAYRWHRRTRDIYKDNYAKYGASRMAMNQNLRAYSNRSITEMYRTNQKHYYARVHNRWWAN